MTVTYEKNPDGSISLDVSADMVSAMALEESGALTMDVDNGELLIRNAAERAPRQQKPKYTMEDLLADYDLIPQDLEENRTWLNSAPLGRELI